MIIAHGGAGFIAQTLQSPNDVRGHVDILQVWGQPEDKQAKP